MMMRVHSWYGFVVVATVTGSIEAEKDNCHEFCKSFGGVAVNVDYRYASRCLEVSKSTRVNE
jgi:hypothetical protein